MSKTNPLEHYQSAYSDSLSNRGGSQPDFLSSLNKLGMEAFSAAGFPTTKWENWKYTDVKKIGATPYKHAVLASHGDKPVGSLSGFRAGAPEGAEIVLLNGEYRSDLSTWKGAEGVTLMSLADAIRQIPERVEAVLGKIGSMEEHPFLALNTAFLNDGVFLELGDDVHLPGVVHILHLCGDPDSALVSHPRMVVVAGERSHATILESVVGLEGAEYFSNAVTEVRVEAGATIKHFLVDRNSDHGNYIGNIQVDQTDNSSYEAHGFWLGGLLVRNDLEVHLNGRGASAKLNGLFLGKGTRHIDNHTLLDHAVPECLSHENYKGILSGQSHGVFNGRVLVQKDAQQTNANQSNRNLLLSDKANIDTKPELEIYADDVRCSHGTTVGQLDEKALFYLQSRGIALEEAFHMLTSAFTEDIMDEIGEPTIDSYIRALVREELSAVQREGV